MEQMPYVKQYPENMPGNWQSFFQKPQPLVLEIGCGRGEYTIGLATFEPDRNYLGVDVKGARIWHGAKAIEENKLGNAGFLRTRVEDLKDYFNNEEVSEIWITFPDPQPRLGKAMKRLTSPRFLALYKQILPKGGIVQLKTDNQDLMAYSLETWLADPQLQVLDHTTDLYGRGNVPDYLQIKTTYEKKFLAEGLTICYLKASIK